MGEVRARRPALWARVTRGLVDVRPGEREILSLLVLLFFCLTAASVTTLAASFALFLSAFGTSALPYLYLGLAPVVASVAFGYVWLSLRLPLNQLVWVTLGFMLAGSVAVRLGLLLPDPRWVVFVLPMWFQAFVNLSFIVVYALAGRIFNAQQGKRLFGLVGAGYWLAVTICGFLVPAVVALVGTSNLLLVAAAATALGTGVLFVIMRLYGERLSVAGEAGPRTGLWHGTDRYAWLMFALVASVWLGFYLVDNILYNRATTQFTSPAQLASFLGIIGGTQGALGLIAATLLTAPILERFGLHAALNIMPVLLLGALGALAVTGTILGGVIALFWLASVAKVTNVSLTFSLEQSSIVMLYQPLPPSERVRQQALAEGIVQPIAIGLAGAFLLLLGAFTDLGAVHLSYVFLALGVGWLAVNAAVVGEYRKALARAIGRRRPLDISAEMTQESVPIIEAGLSSPSPEAVLYAMSLLDGVAPQRLQAALPGLLGHAHPAVRREALRWAERTSPAGLNGAVLACATSDPDPGIRGYALGVLAALDGGRYMPEVAGRIADPDPSVRSGAIAALLRHGGEAERRRAEEALQALVDSAGAADRALAMAILRDAPLPGPPASVLLCLQDPAPEVREAAWWAAAAHPSGAMWPLAFEALDDAAVRPAALAALVAGGDEALPAVEAALTAPGADRRQVLRLVRVCGRIGGAQATAVLLRLLDTADLETRDAVLAALHARGYHASADDASGLEDRLAAETALGEQYVHAHAALGADGRLHMLAAALEHAARQVGRHILYLLSFGHDARTIMNARDALRLGSETKRAYALELLATILPSAHRAAILSLLDPATLGQRSPAETAHEALGNRDEWLEMLAAGSGFAHDPWVQTCALDGIGRVGAQNLRPAALSALSAPDKVVRETAQLTLMALDSQLGPGTHAGSRSAGTVVQGGTIVISTLEKVMILKSVGIFAGTPDHILAEIADILVEIEARPGETIVARDEPGDSMYVIVSGRVRVHDGDYTLTEMGDREVFGEMTVLDPEARAASVTALEDTHLFRLDHEPFFELASDRIEIVQGILRVITGYVRARTRDVATLNRRLQEIEGTRSA